MNKNENCKNADILLTIMGIKKPELVSNINVTDITFAFISEIVDKLDIEVSKIENKSNIKNNDISRIIDIQIILPYIALCMVDLPYEEPLHKKLRKLNRKCKKNLDKVDPL